jgi:wobble nucleotide-excising tRNase
LYSVEGKTPRIQDKEKQRATQERQLHNNEQRASRIGEKNCMNGQRQGQFDDKAHNFGRLEVQRKLKQEDENSKLNNQYLVRDIFF